VLTLRELEEKFRKWLLEEYHSRVQKGQSLGPQDRWEEGGYLPRMPESLEQLDLLLVMVARKRRVQQSGIAFEGHQYIDPALSAYVGEEIMVRYDPMDKGSLKVYFQDKFVCTAICPELSGKTVSLKEIVAARTERRKELRGELAEREAAVKHYVNPKSRAKGASSRAVEEPKEVSLASEEPVKGSERKEAEVPEKKKLKRYINE